MESNVHTDVMQMGRYQNFGHQISATSTHLNRLGHEEQIADDGQNDVLILVHVRLVYHGQDGLECRCEYFRPLKLGLHRRKDVLEPHFLHIQGIRHKRVCNVSKL